MNFEDFINSNVKSGGQALPLYVTIFGHGFERATQSITVPGTSEMEIDLSKFAPMCNYKLQIVPLCPMEEEPGERAAAVSE